MWLCGFGVLMCLFVWCWGCVAVVGFRCLMVLWFGCVGVGGVVGVGVLAIGHWPLTIGN